MICPAWNNSMLIHGWLQMLTEDHPHLNSFCHELVDEHVLSYEVLAVTVYLITQMKLWAWVFFTWISRMQSGKEMGQNFDVLEVSATSVSCIKQKKLCCIHTTCTTPSRQGNLNNCYGVDLSISMGSRDVMLSVIYTWNIWIAYVKKQ